MLARCGLVVMINSVAISFSLVWPCTWWWFVVMAGLLCYLLDVGFVDSSRFW